MASFEEIGKSRLEETTLRERLLYAFMAGWRVEDIVESLSSVLHEAFKPDSGELPETVRLQYDSLLACAIELATIRKGKV